MWLVKACGDRQAAAPRPAEEFNRRNYCHQFLIMKPITLWRFLAKLFAVVSLLLTFSVLASTNFFPIMAWDWPPNDLAAMKRLRDCGFTLAGFVPPEALDNCARAGLQAVVIDPRSRNYNWTNVDEASARKNIAGLVAEVGGHPAVFGYYLRDEPGANLFPGLATVASLFRESAPGRWPYINLFPDYAYPSTLGTTNYAEYLECFIATCRPQIVSYDNYSLMDDGSVRENFWSNLESVRAACRKHGLDFWNIILAVAHFNYAEPTAAGFRLQAYSSLACGGRGLAYFTYFAPRFGNYRAAAVDQFGNETPTWQLIQNVNLQIQKLAPTLLQLSCDDAYHLGDVPVGCHGSSTNSLVTGLEGGNALVGDFTHRDGSRYVMVVNKSLTRSRTCWPQFRQPPKSLKYTSSYTGALTAFEGEAVWLSPGQGVLIKPEW
jgi:hypothetical protein